MLKGQNGVTLISLVVTIIVLLILTGVSLSMVLGQNGVLTQASTAVVEQTKADVTEKVSTAMTSIETEYKGAWAKDTSIKRDEYYLVSNLEDQFTGEIVVYDVTTDFYGAGFDAAKLSEAEAVAKKIDIAVGDGYLDTGDDEENELKQYRMYLIMLTENGSTTFSLVSFADKKLDVAPRINGEKQSKAAGSTYVSYIDIGDSDVAEYDEDKDLLTIHHPENIVINWNPSTETESGSENG